MTYNYNNSIDVASLISARICHDLISPIGAINNGLELLGLSGIQQGPEYDLIASSAENANARINFFRMAFGPSSSDEISTQLVLDTIDGAYRDHRCYVNWGISTPQIRSDVKLCFLLIQCLESALGSGGTINLTKENDIWHISAKGSRIYVVTETWDHLQGKYCNNAIKAADVHFELARQELDKSKYNIEVNIGEATLDINLSQSIQP